MDWAGGRGCQSTDGLHVRGDDWPRTMSLILGRRSGRTKRFSTRGKSSMTRGLRKGGTCLKEQKGRRFCPEKQSEREERRGNEATRTRSLTITALFETTIALKDCLQKAYRDG